MSETSTKTRKPTPAQARKAAAVDAYTKAYGRAPVGRMSAEAIERRLPRAAPTQRIAAAPQPAPAAAKSVTSAPAAAIRRPAFRPMQSAVLSALPTGFYGRYLDARIGSRENKFTPDRKAAAQVLRDYRSTLGRDRPSSLATAKGFAQKAEVVVREGAKMVAKRQPLSSPHWAFGIGAGLVGSGAAASGFMSDGVRGMARGIVSTATFGLATPVFNAAFGDGKDNPGRILDALGAPRNKAEVVQKRVADKVNERPTMKAAEYLHKTAGAPKPAKIKDPVDDRAGFQMLGALGAGAIGTFATPYLMTKMGEGVVRGATAVAGAAPAIGRFVGRLAGPAGFAAVAGIGAGVSAYQAYRGGASAGGVVSAAAKGAIGLPYNGLSAQDAKTFASADAAFQGMQQINAARQSDSGGHGKGYANPANQLAAQQARGVVNISPWAQSGATPQGKRK